MFASKLSSKIRSFFQDRRKVTTAGLLAVVLLLGAFLRFYHLGASGVGNTYYAATVKSMLTSWHNFFFAAFEPGGSISVDKPPLGFWVQALSAYFLGVSGFALALPNAIAGVLSIFVTYKLIRRPFGTWAGLAAALTLAVMPVAISAERNNTIDGLLVFVLLLAAWAFLHAVYSGKLRWLFLGAFIVGLGFNIKMLQAFMPLPAFYALYFFGMKQKWWKKLLHLAAATVLLLVVSFSWAIAVDMVPAADRPYVDSTSKNSVMELIFEHNGIERFTNQRISFDGGQDGLFALDGSNNQSQTTPKGQGIPQPSGENLQESGGFSQPPTSGQVFPPGAGNPAGGIGPGNGGGPGGGGQPGSMDFGTAGTLRLFTQPLVGEASWLLPFVLGGLVVLALALRKQPFDEKHASVILWAAWLLPEVIYFTYSTGLMHAYYLIMLAAPVAALAGMTGWALWQMIRKHTLPGWGLLLLLATGTLVFQGITLWGKTDLALWAISAACIIFGLGLCCLALSMVKARLAPVALSLLLAALLIAPALWSGLTTFDSSSNGGLPAAGPSGQGFPGVAAGQGDGNGDGRMQSMVNIVPGNNAQSAQSSQTLLNYLLANTKPGAYLLATDRASDAATYILATGRPVLTFGGFLGQYNEVSVAQLAALVKSGRLRFVLSQGLQGHPEIAQWVQKNCIQVVISESNSSGMTVSPLPGSRPNQSLYDCGG